MVTYANVGKQVNIRNGDDKIWREDMEYQGYFRILLALINSSKKFEI